MNTQYPLAVVPALDDFVSHPRAARCFRSDEYNNATLPFHLAVNPSFDGLVALPPDSLPGVAGQLRLRFDRSDVPDGLDTPVIRVVVEAVEYAACQRWSPFRGACVARDLVAPGGGDVTA